MSSPTRAALALIALVAMAACGSSREVARTPSDPSAPVEAGPVTLPPPPTAVPAFAVRLRHAVSERDLKRLEATRPIEAITAARLHRLPVRSLMGEQRLTVAAVDPLALRPLTPASTRRADFVWTSLLAGRAIVSFDAARALGVDRKAATIVVDDGRVLEVGAVADNATPNVADVLIRTDLAPGSKRGTDVVLVGARDRHAIPAAARLLRARFPKARLHPLRQAPGAAAPEATAQTQSTTIPGMAFRILRNGYIDPDPAWVASNITTASVPILGRVTCHRLMMFPLSAALSEIQREGLARLIDTSQYGGCYTPRFIDRDPSKPVSMHAFGLAVDFNVTTNQLGTAGDMDPRIVEIFEKWGFYWGGRWSRPDPMHFELHRLLRPPG